MHFFSCFLQAQSDVQSRVEHIEVLELELFQCNQEIEQLKEERQVKAEETVRAQTVICSFFTKYFTTLQSIMNAKLSKHRFWHCHENGLIKMIQTIDTPQPIGECQVNFPLSEFINQDNP